MYDAPMTVAPLLLSVVLIVSGGMKALDHETAQEAFVSLRLPQILIRLRAPQILPIAEIGLALALLLTRGGAAVVASLIALTVFVAYLVVIARALGFAEPVTCSCFGKLGLGTVDRFTAVRNAVLVFLALLTVYDATRGHGVIERITKFSGTDRAWLLAVVTSIILTWLVAGHRPSTRSAASRPNTPDGGLRQPIPFAHLRTPSDEVVTLRELARARSTLLLLVSPTCGSCQSVIATARTWQHKNPSVRTILVLGSAPGAPTGLAHEDDFDILFDPQHDVGRLFEGGSPTAVLLGADGVIAGGPAVGKENVMVLLDSISQRSARATSAATPTTASSHAAIDAAPAAATAQAGNTTPAAAAQNTSRPDYEESRDSTQAADSQESSEHPRATDSHDDPEAYLRVPTPFALFTDGSGASVSLRDLGAAGPTVLLLVSPSCGSCLEVLDRSPNWQAQLRGVPIHYVVHHPYAVDSLRERGIPDDRILLDEPAAVSTMMRTGTPSLFAVGPDERLLAGPVSGLRDVSETMEEIIVEVTAARAATTEG